MILTPEEENQDNEKKIYAIAYEPRERPAHLQAVFVISLRPFYQQHKKTQKTYTVKFRENKEAVKGLYASRMQDAAEKSPRIGDGFGTEDNPADDDEEEG